MDKEHVKGALDEAKGELKEAVGHVTGDKKLEVDGELDRAKGKAHIAVGNAKDAAREAVNDVNKRP
jgi:uncharacterized protein YjbJ (UPF0337 family)